VIDNMLFHPALSVVTVLAAFMFMIWPGYALLHLLGFGRHRWPLAEFAGAPMTLAIWIIAMSGAAWASIPLASLSTAVCILMVMLAALGIALRISVQQSVEIETSEQRYRHRLLWLIAVLLPFVIMPSLFRFGLGIFANSIFPDGWSYITMADYLAHVPRGSEGGLSPLHQYASHMANARNASAALLGHLSMLFGVQADQMLTLYSLLVLFANACALSVFAGTVYDQARPARNFLLISGYLMPALVLYFANLDQLLLIPMLPLIAAMAVKLGMNQTVTRCSILIGILIAAATYAYIEMAFLGVIIALSFIVSPAERFRTSFVRGTIAASIFIPIAILLTWPALSPLLNMLKSQYASATMPVRPGEGFFPLFTSDFLWSRTGRLLLCVATISFALIATGAWIERRRWTVNLALAAVMALCLFFTFQEVYLYGTYKILSVNFWLFCFFAVVGGERVMIVCRPISWLGRRGLYNADPAVLFIALIAIVALKSQGSQQLNGLQQIKYREASELADMVGSSPTLVSVRDDLANEWAVFYLSKMPTIINPYRIYMAQPHVLPFMERTKTVDLASIRYIVTDHGDDVRSTVTGASLVRDGQTYSLWKIDDVDWTVTADVGVHIDRLHPSGRESTVIAQSLSSIDISGAVAPAR
jgi:hypothetical protein